MLYIYIYGQTVAEKIMRLVIVSFGSDTHNYAFQPRLSSFSVLPYSWED